MSGGAKAVAAAMLGEALLIGGLVLALRHEHQRPTPVPMIVTQHDTVHDTLRLELRPPAPKPGTPNLTISVTIHDTSNLNAGEKPQDRANLWPVLSLSVGRRVGDTTTANTFSLRTGQVAVSRFYTAGPLLNVWADSTGAPRLLFGDSPRPPRVSIWTKAEWTAVGWGGCTVVNAIASVLRPH